jgi:hypothetical protein
MKIKFYKSIVWIFTLLVISMQNFSAEPVNITPDQNQTQPTDNLQKSDDLTPTPKGQSSEPEAQPDAHTDTQKNDNPKADKKLPELARVAIVPMQDRTGSKNFGYLSESLSDAINSSMQKNFLYTQIDSSEIKQAVFDLEQAALVMEKEANEQKNFFSDLFQPKLKPKSAERIQLEKIQKLAKKLNADIVIYGNYIFDEKGNEMIISTSFYFGLVNAIRPISDMRNAVDNTIFAATDKVAKTIIVEIDLMVVSFEKNHPEAVEETASAEVLTEKTTAPENTSTTVAVEPAVEGEKAISPEINAESVEKDTQKNEEPESITETVPAMEEPAKKALTREMAKETTGKPIEEEIIEVADNSSDWQKKKISISLLPGFYINQISTPGLCGTCEMQLGLAGRYWIFSNVYLGAKINFGEIWSEKMALGSLALLDGFAAVGYSLPVDRWLFSADLGMGYYFVPGKAKVDNPAFSVSAQVEYMLSDLFSIGLSANAHMYYDQPKSLTFMGLAISLNYNL